MDGAFLGQMLSICATVLRAALRALGLGHRKGSTGTPPRTQHPQLTCIAEALCMPLHVCHYTYFVVGKNCSILGLQLRPLAVPEFGKNGCICVSTRTCKRCFVAMLERCTPKAEQDVHWLFFMSEYTAGRLLPSLSEHDLFAKAKHQTRPGTGQSGV